jgi:hypothetical protein
MPQAIRSAVAVTPFELFTIGHLRAHGVSWPTLRKARAEPKEVEDAWKFERRLAA